MLQLLQFILGLHTSLFRLYIYKYRISFWHCVWVIFNCNKCNTATELVETDWDRIPWNADGYWASHTFGCQWSGRVFAAETAAPQFIWGSKTPILCVKIASFLIKLLCSGCFFLSFYLCKNRILSWFFRAKILCNLAKLSTKFRNKHRLFCYSATVATVHFGVIHTPFWSWKKRGFIIKMLRSSWFFSLLFGQKRDIFRNFTPEIGKK